MSEHEETKTEQPAAILTVTELAALLKIERKTAYAAIKAGRIPGARRIGRVIRISRQTVLDWLAQGGTREVRGRAQERK